MNAVGIDVSKGKSMVAALRPMGEVALLPQEFLHTEVGLEQMAYAIVALGEDTRVIMEATGRYHEPVAAALHEYGIYVCVLNPLFIKQSGGGSIRKVKTGKAYFLNLPGMVLTTGAICENIIAITILFMLMYSLRTAVCPYAFNYRTNHCTDRTCYARTF